MRVTRFLHGTKWQYALGEIILIIIGVTVALMVDEWRQARNDSRLIDEYVVRLIQDLENEAIEWRRIDRAMLEKIEALDNALGWLSNPDQSTLAVSEFLTNLTVGSRMAYGSGAYVGSSTFEELINTGRFGLIEDPDTRKVLLTYYGWVETHRIRQVSRQTEYAPTIYKLIPRDPEFQVQGDLSDARLRSIASRAQEYDLEGLIIAERNRARLRREIAADIIARGSDAIQILKK